MAALHQEGRARSIEIGGRQAGSDRLCNFRERKTSFYLRQLIEAEKSSSLSRSDGNFRKFLSKAEVLLESHRLLHELVR